MRRAALRRRGSVFLYGADGESRTPTGLPPLTPEASASANSATSALGVLATILYPGTGIWSMWRRKGIFPTELLITISVLLWKGRDVPDVKRGNMNGIEESRWDRYFIWALNILNG